MKFKIKSDDLGIPYCDEILRIVCNVTEKYNCGFIIVGAFARDLNFEIVYKYEEVYRATSDIDFGIAISDWQKYDTIVQDLVKAGFEKSKGKGVHRLFYKNIPIDLVPFGGVEEDGEIKWPPDFSFVMSVAGFSEVFNTAIEFELSDEIIFKVASLAGLMILKIIAWEDRKNTTEKDGEDILFLLHNYLEIDSDALYEENIDLMERKDYVYSHAGAQVMARKIKSILSGSPDIMDKIENIINSETLDIETSQLAGVQGYNRNIVNNYNLLEAFKKELLA